MTSYDITSLEETFKQLILTGGVSAKVYTNRPKSNANLADFVVVRVTGKVRDRAYFADALVSVALFARNVENIKNGKKLSVMYERLCQCIVPKIGRYLIDIEPVVSSDIADDYGFHARIITFSVTISIADNNASTNS